MVIIQIYPLKTNQHLFISLFPKFQLFFQNSFLLQEKIHNFKDNYFLFHEIIMNFLIMQSLRSHHSFHYQLITIMTLIMMTFCTRYLLSHYR